MDASEPTSAAIRHSVASELDTRATQCYSEAFDMRDRAKRAAEQGEEKLAELFREAGLACTGRGALFEQLARRARIEAR
jgi:hypothetical protein